ncbi:MAG: glycoside hydrolase family 5 protein, partial [Limisphaerales bacterium]
MKQITIVRLIFLSALLTISQAFAQSSDGTFTPANPPEMKPITNHDTPAYRAATHFLRGVNLGGYLEVPPGQHWGDSVSVSEFATIKREGFDHVRVPIGWQYYTGPAPNFILSPKIFARVDFVVTNALNNHLAVLINIHDFNALDQNSAQATPEFLALWKQIAAHYKNFPRQLAFELDNEPHNKATAAVMNPIYARTIAEIRQTNPRRTIFVEPSGWGSTDDLNNLVLPPDDNVIVSIHCYDPFYFTHQGATWTGGQTPVTGIIFPGPPAQPLVPDPNLHLKNYQLDWIEKYNT